MQKKKIGIWFVITAVLAVAGFMTPGMSRDMFQKGTMSESTASVLITAALPVAFVASVTAISLLIYLFTKKKD